MHFLTARPERVWLPRLATSTRPRAATNVTVPQRSQLSTICPRCWCWAPVPAPARESNGRLDSPRAVATRTHPSCFTPSPRGACGRWPPNSHPLRQSPGRSVSGPREPSRLQAERPKERSAAASEGGRGMARDSPDANARTPRGLLHRRGSRLATQGGDISRQPRSSVRRSPASGPETTAPTSRR
jgi:hypothetical protein